MVLKLFKKKTDIYNINKNINKNDIYNICKFNFIAQFIDCFKNPEIILQFSTVPYSHSLIGMSYLELGIVDLFEQLATTVQQHRSHLRIPEHT